MQVVTTYLEQTSPDELVPSRKPAEPLVIARAEEPSPEFTRFLLTAVGGQWHWTDKLDRTWDQWWQWVTRRSFETWVAWLRGTPVGYAELMGTVGHRGGGRVVRPTPGSPRTEVRRAPTQPGPAGGLAA